MPRRYPSSHQPRLAIVLVVLVVMFMGATASRAAGATDRVPSSPGEPALANAAPSTLLDDVPSTLPEPSTPEDEASLRLDDDAFRAWHAEVRGDRGEVIDQDGDPFAAIDACMTQDMADRGAHGASIAVLNEGELVYARGYGLKHPEREDAIDPDTLFRIGSTTKMMTAAGVMQQVEQGSIDLHAPVTTYVPGFEIAAPWDASAITTHHLMTHSAGIPDDLTGAYGPTTLEEWAASRGVVQLYAPPGSFYNYSNPSWSLAGLVLQRTTGRPYRSYLVDEVWRPAGMARTTMDPAAVIADGNFAMGGGPAGTFAPDDYDSLWGGPAGFAFSTPTELVAWAKLLMDGGGDVLSEESASAMQGRRIDLQSIPGLYYGYGIMRSEELPGLTLLQHGGNIDGYSSQLYWVPERAFAVSVLASSPQSLSNAARCAILEVVQPELPDPGDRSTDPDTWAAYAGTYVSQNRDGDQTTIWVHHTGDGLMLKQGSAAPEALVQRYLNTFQTDQDGDGAGDGAELTFIEHPDRPGRAEWLRNRGFVAIRVGEVPSSVPMRGATCAPLTFTAHAAMPRLVGRGWGLDNLHVARADVPVTADDPEDPSSAGFQLDLQADEPIAVMEIRLTGEEDDDLDLFLLYDRNEDGAFSYPDELAGAGTTSSANERIQLGGTRPLPPGAYQVWVQGWAVEGDASTFDLDVLAITGEGLRLEGLPAAIEAGERVEATVCAQPASIAGADGPRRGVIVLSTGGNPRDVIVPIEWQPGDEPGPGPEPAAGRLFIPWAAR